MRTNKNTMRKLELFTQLLIAQAETLKAVAEADKADAEADKAKWEALKNAEPGTDRAT